LEENLRRQYTTAVEQCFRESIEAKEALLRAQTGLILNMAEALAQAFRGHHKLFIFGNGGSAADAQHLAAEFVNRFERERPPLPALALTVDTSVLTCIANDYSFEDIFVKQLRALAEPGDAALGISTSGSSPNVVKALRWASEHGLRTLGLAGEARSEMDTYCDQILHVPSKVTARVQECHITVAHVLCGLVEEILFQEAEKTL